MVSIKKKMDRFGREMVVFAVTIGNNHLAYMCVDRAIYGNENRGVVIVNSKSFLSLWQAEPVGNQKKFAFGTVNSWMNERKYQGASMGFKESSKFPALLANVVCNSEEIENIVKRKKFILFSIDRIEKKTVKYLSITNGVTRTIWLLANGAESFPVEVDIAEASLLHSLAGEIGSKIMTVEELYSCIRP